MATVACPDCGKTVSTSAYDCPECGRAMRRKGGMSGWTVLFGAMAFVFMGMAGLDLAHSDAFVKAVPWWIMAPLSLLCAFGALRANRP